MFSGIIQTIGVIKQKKEHGDGFLFVIVPNTSFDHIEEGSSIAVNGVCLTVRARVENGWEFEVMSETLSKTTLGSLSVGDTVNLERSLRLGEEMSGHMVYGHVDETAVVIEAVFHGEKKYMVIQPSATFMQYIVPQGGVCVDGVSLTVSAVKKDSFEVSFIEYTLEHTTLQKHVVGNLVNLEADMVLKFLRSQSIVNEL